MDEIELKPCPLIEEARLILDEALDRGLEGGLVYRAREWLDKATLTRTPSPQPDQETVERVAKAIFIERVGYFSPEDDASWDNAGAHAQDHHRDLARAAIAALNPPPGNGGGWQPIETAPKDGTYVLIATESHDGGMTTACWDAEWSSSSGWWLLDNGKDPEIPLRGAEPTHWMPLPAAPSIADRTNQEVPRG